MLKSFHRVSSCLLVSTLFLSANAQAQNDFTATEAQQKTCQLQADQQFKLGVTPQDQQSQVICRNIALVKHVAQWVEQIKVSPPQEFTDQNFHHRVRAELTHLRNELSASRQVLERLKIKKGQGLMMQPAEWKMDLTGDSLIQPWEEYFFAIVKPGERPFRLSMPSDDPAYYEKHFNLNARFRLDQSDVYWALAYHQFFEGFANLILSFKLHKPEYESLQLKMVDASSLKKAHQLILAGFKTSDKMRLSLLAETDDEDEWIPNPRQKNHVFPLVMDKEGFDLWARFLKSLIPLWEGKTLFVAPKNGGGILGDAAKLCRADEGLNIATLFNQPGEKFVDFHSLHYACSKVDAKHPASDFAHLVQNTMERAQKNRSSPEWHFVRYLYWVN